MRTLWEGGEERERETEKTRRVEGEDQEGGRGGDSPPTVPPPSKQVNGTESETLRLACAAS